MRKKELNCHLAHRAKQGFLVKLIPLICWFLRHEDHCILGVIIHHSMLLSFVLLPKDQTFQAKNIREPFPDDNVVPTFRQCPLCFYQTNMEETTVVSIYCQTGNGNFTPQSPMQQPLCLYRTKRCIHGVLVK